MTPSRSHLAARAMLAGLVTALAIAAAAPAGADEPCAELKLSGSTVLELPCPEQLGRLLESPLLKPQHGDDDAMVIDPDWPHDQAMIAEHDWPYDQEMIVPRADPGQNAAPLLEDLLGLLDRHLSRHPEGRAPSKRYLQRATYPEPAE